MGSASSISNERGELYSVYISYNDLLKIEYLKQMCDKIGSMGFNVITSEVSQLCEDKYDIENFTDSINKVMKESKYLIVCISNDTIKSFIQTIELNTALEYRDKIIYIITERILNPMTNIIIKSVIKDNMWFHCKDDTSFNCCLHNISELLIK